MYLYIVLSGMKEHFLFVVLTKYIIISVRYSEWK
jgi:hypothetical protein